MCTRGRLDGHTEFFSHTPQDTRHNTQDTEKEDRKREEKDERRETREEKRREERSPSKVQNLTVFSIIYIRFSELRELLQKRFSLCVYHTAIGSLR